MKIKKYTKELEKKHDFTNALHSGLGYNGKGWDIYTGALLTTERVEHKAIPKFIVLPDGDNPSSCTHKFETWESLEERIGAPAILSLYGHWCSKCGQLENHDEDYSIWTPVAKDVIDPAIKKANEKIAQLEKEKEELKAELEAKAIEINQAYEHWWKAKEIYSESSSFNKEYRNSDDSDSGTNLY